MGNLQVLAIIAVVYDASVLAERPIGANAVRFNRILDYDFAVDAGICISDDRGVQIPETLVNANLGDVEQICACGVTKAMSKRAIRSPCNVSARICLRLR